MRLIFIDTETTSLRHDRRVWEVGLIIRDPGKEDHEYQLFVDDTDLDLGNADPFSLKIGGFYERHPQYAKLHNELTMPEAEMLSGLEYQTRDAHLIGALPSFDADVISTRMRAHNILPSWHYHLIDMEPMVVGYLHGRGKPVPDLPWSSNALYEAIGINPAKYERHTALGDARRERDAWEIVTG
jgi:DNA polymerase III epsilon subunit-like protein